MSRIRYRDLLDKEPASLTNVIAFLKNWKTNNPTATHQEELDNSTQMYLNYEKNPSKECYLQLLQSVGNLIWNKAKQMYVHSCGLYDIDECISISMRGFEDAVRSYDKSYGVPFFIWTQTKMWSYWHGISVLNEMKLSKNSVSINILDDYYESECDGIDIILGGVKDENLEHYFNTTLLNMPNSKQLINYIKKFCEKLTKHGKYYQYHNYYKVFEMRYLKKMTFKEIGEVIGDTARPEHDIQQRLETFLRLLREDYYLKSLFEKLKS